MTEKRTLIRLWKVRPGDSSMLERPKDSEGAGSTPVSPTNKTRRPYMPIHNPCRVQISAVSIERVRIAGKELNFSTKVSCRGCWKLQNNQYADRDSFESWPNDFLQPLEDRVLWFPQVVGVCRPIRQRRLFRGLSLATSCDLLRAHQKWFPSSGWVVSMNKTPVALSRAVYR